MKNKLNKYMEDANRFFHQVAKESGDPQDTERAFQITRAVFHSLRERISAEESMHLIAQLPIVLKGIYVDGWKITLRPSNINTVDEFLSEVKAYTMQSESCRFENDREARNAVHSVLKVMDQYVSEGERKDIRAQLPKEIASLFE